MSDVPHWGSPVEMMRMQRRLDNQCDTIDQYHERWHHFASVSKRNHVLEEQLERAQNELRRMREALSK